LSKWR